MLVQRFMRGPVMRRASKPLGPVWFQDRVWVQFQKNFFILKHHWMKHACLVGFLVLCTKMTQMQVVLCGAYLVAIYGGPELITAVRLQKSGGKTYDLSASQVRAELPLQDSMALDTYLKAV